MSATAFFQPDPVCTARRLHKEGKGQEDNPYAFETTDRRRFFDEMRKLQLKDYNELMGECLHG